MHQMPIELLDNAADDRLVIIKQQLVLHDPDEFVQIYITNKQIPDLIKALQSRLTRPKRNGKPEAASESKFESHFWNLYPSCKRKVNRAGCLKLWQSRNLDTEAEAIAQAVRRAAASADWTKENGEFIPMPITWLRQARWEAPDAGGPAADSSWSRVI